MSGGHGPVDKREKEREKERVVKLEGNWRLSFFFNADVLSLGAQYLG
jgi:hypothetical protein